MAEERVKQTIKVTGDLTIYILKEGHLSEIQVRSTDQTMGNMFDRVQRSRYTGQFRFSLERRSVRAKVRIAEGQVPFEFGWMVEGIEVGDVLLIKPASPCVSNEETFVDTYIELEVYAGDEDLKRIKSWQNPTNKLHL